MRSIGVGLALLAVGNESAVPSFVELVRPSSKVGEGCEQAWVGQELGPVGGGRCLLCGFEKPASESYKPSALQKKVVYGFSLVAQLTRR